MKKSKMPVIEAAPERQYVNRVDELTSRITMAEDKATHVTIRPPDFGEAIFTVRGLAPLVIHRFSLKCKQQMAKKQETGKAASSKKERKPQDMDDTFNESRYISREGWDGFNAASIRVAMVDACRLVGYKMTLAKMSVFVEADGWDKFEPQIPLIRIFGKAQRQDDMARVETGQPYITVRAAYMDWSAKIRIRWDKDQFTLQDVANLLSRVGMQVGIGEGRPFSKNSAGMGWGVFRVETPEEQKRS
jgi:hypothetical protein